MTLSRRPAPGPALRGGEGGGGGGRRRRAATSGVAEARNGPPLGRVPAGRVRAGAEAGAGAAGGASAERVLIPAPGIGAWHGPIPWSEASETRVRCRERARAGGRRRRSPCNGPPFERRDPPGRAVGDQRRTYRRFGAMCVTKCVCGGGRCSGVEVIWPARQARAKPRALRVRTARPRRRKSRKMPTRTRP